MKPFYKNLNFIAFGVLAFLGLSISSITAQTSISSIGTPFTQNFDSLTTTFHPSLAWANKTTLANWYALGYNGSGVQTIPTSFILNDGSTTTSNSLSSFGNTADRAFGFVPGGNTNGQLSFVGWRFKNNMLSTTINSISITWTLEQWRKVSTGAQALTIWYQISSSAITSIVTGSLTNSGKSQLSPQFSSGVGTLDGNSAANRVTTTHTIDNLNIPPGSEILICWANAKSSANHLMGVDDLSIVAKADQTITFDPIPTKTFGDASFALNASATSGLTVSYSSDNTNVATISGNILTIRGPGTAEITASQAGNANYNAAPIQVQTFSASPSMPIVKAATSISQAGFTTNWDANNGLRDATTSYIIEFSTDNSFESTYDFHEPLTKSQRIDSWNLQDTPLPLIPNTIYYYRVYSTNVGLYSAYSASLAVTTGTDYVTINTGNWDTGANWDVGEINNIANSITIRHPITLNTARASVTTNKLVIESTGKLTTNQIIHVTNELIIEVAADGTAGQILNTNNIIVGENAKITVRKTFASGEWSFIGFPFTVTSDNVFNAANGAALTWGNLNSGANYIVQQYDGAGRASAGTAEYVGAGLHWANVSPKEFTAKKGYIVYNNTGNVIDFTTIGSSIGSFFSRTGTSLTTVKYPSTSEHRDWNLITMPLSSKYNLANATSTSYYAYNGINYLPALAGETLDVQPFSAFFVQAPSTSISFANGGRKVVAASRVEEKPVDDIYLNLSNGNSTYDDFTRIRLQEGASAGYEIGTDAVKMFGLNSKVSYIYTAINNTTASINTLPRTVSEVELNTKFAAPGNYSISISNLDRVQSYAAVILVDKVTGKRTDLLSTGSYEYTVGTAGTSNRFKVQFAPKITTGVSVSDDYNLKITSQNGNAYITGLNASAQVRVYDATGKMVFNNTVNNNEPIRFENKGLYIFEIANSEKTEKIKTFIR